MIDSNVIIGLDQSLVATGYCVMTSEKSTVVETGEIFGGNYKGADRLIHIQQQLQQLINKYENRLLFVAIEDYSYGSKGRATFSLGELGGIIKITIVSCNFMLMTVPIATWKKIITGSGNTKKDMVRLSVFKKYKFESPSQNIIDAFSICKFYCYYLNWKNGGTFSKIDCQTFEKFRKYESLVK